MEVKNKLYLATAIINFMVCGMFIANGHYVMASLWAVAGGIWLYLWRRKE